MRVYVPFRSRNMSSLFSTYFRISGKTATIFARSSSDFEFFSKEQSRSSTCDSIEASTTEMTWLLSGAGLGLPFDSSYSARFARPSAKLIVFF